MMIDFEIISEMTRYSDNIRDTDTNIEVTEMPGSWKEVKDVENECSCIYFIC